MVKDYSRGGQGLVKEWSWVSQWMVNEMPRGGQWSNKKCLLKGWEEFTDRGGGFTKGKGRIYCRVGRVY